MQRDNYNYRPPSPSRARWLVLIDDLLTGIGLVILALGLVALLTLLQ